MPARAAVVYSASYTCDIGPHVFPMAKFRLVRDALVEAGDVAAEDVLEPVPANAAELLRAHTREYLEDLEHLRWTERTMYSELPLERDIVRAYVLAAGGTLVAARESLTRGAGINLGGGFHHAGPARAEGFCYINDLAVAVRTLQHERRVRRAAVVDLDVHQGNGTAIVFQSDPDVFTLSVHQENNYPVPKAHSTLDVGLADRTGDREYAERLEEALAAVWSFEPGIVLYQAGADPYGDDQLGGLALTFAGLETRDRMVIEGCRARGIPFVVTLGGGYARALADTLRIHVQTCRLALSPDRGRAGG